MLVGYNIDEVIDEGLGKIIADHINSEIQAVNDEYDVGEDPLQISEIDVANRIYKEYITIDELMNIAEPFPAMCYFMTGSNSDIRTNHLERFNHTFVVALFIDGEEGRKKAYRYKSAVEKVLNKYDCEIYTGIMRGRVVRTRYYQPIKYESSAHRVAELIIEINSEVRR